MRFTLCSNMRRPRQKVGYRCSIDVYRKRRLLEHSQSLRQLTVVVFLRIEDISPGVAISKEGRTYICMLTVRAGRVR